MSNLSSGHRRGVVVLDGLDEVADIDLRTRVVEEIEVGIQRLDAVAESLQVLVTTRPAAFANSPGFSSDRFLHLELVHMDFGQVSQYTDRWVQARRLGEKDATEVRDILRARLTEPHFRELARNPMQLAILLSLIHTRGASLPDKRTALYAAYMELFFNREAEKSEVVRRHRELLDPGTRVPGVAAAFRGGDTSAEWQY